MAAIWPCLFAAWACGLITDSREVIELRGSAWGSMDAWVLDPTQMPHVSTCD